MNPNHPKLILIRTFDFESSRGFLTPNFSVRPPLAFFELHCRLSQTSLPEYVLDGIIDKARERIKVVRTILRSNPSDPLGLGVLKMAGACVC